MVGSQLRWPRHGAAKAKEHEPRDADGVTASEFSFLALGLVLGLISGAAIIEFVRARPPAPREVRLTVSHDAVPRRSSTLADDAFTVAGPQPARGGPADRRLLGSPLPAGAPDRRTTVRLSPAVVATAGGAAGAMTFQAAIAITRDAGPPVPGRTTEPVLPLTGLPSSPPVDATEAMVAIPISSGDDPVAMAIRLGPAATPGVAMGRMAAVAARGVAPQAASRSPAPDRQPQAEQAAAVARPVSAA